MGTIEQPSILKEVDSVVGASKFSGMSSDNSMNLPDKMCETSLARTGGRPGPKINAWLKLLLIPVVTIGAGTDSRKGKN